MSSGGEALEPAGEGVCVRRSRLSLRAKGVHFARVTRGTAPRAVVCCCTPPLQSLALVQVQQRHFVVHAAPSQEDAEQYE